MGLRLWQGAREAAGGFAGAARHLAWYLSYCVDGSATRECREREQPVAQSRSRRAS